MGITLPLKKPSGTKEGLETLVQMLLLLPLEFQISLMLNLNPRRQDNSRTAITLSLQPNIKKQLKFKQKKLLKNS